jgi:hypothetical protein
VLEDHATMTNNGVKVKLHAVIISAVGRDELLTSRSGMIITAVIG